VTVTFAVVPGAPAGEVAVIDVELLTVKDNAGWAPNITDDTLKNPVPVMATAVPPMAGPLERPPTTAATDATDGPKKA
jgi:hypothetical protein